MKILRFALCALAFAGLAQARPVVIEEVATLSIPDPSWQYLGRFGVAIDGDFALVSGERYVADPAIGTRHEGAAFIYQRSGTSWNYTGRLGPIAVIPAGARAGLAMKDGVAMTIMERWRIFEREATTWTLARVAGMAPNALQGPDIEIDGGRILAARVSCNYESVVLRKFGSTWRVEGELFGQGNGCEANVLPIAQDLQGGRVVVLNHAGDTTSPNSRVREYRLNANGSGWSETGGASNGSIGNILGPDIALAHPFYAVAGNRERGTGVIYELDPPVGPVNGAWAHFGLPSVDSFLEPDPWSATAIERVGTMFAQRNFDANRNAYVIRLFRVNDDQAHTSTQMATLQPSQGGSVGDRMDASGNRIIVGGQVELGYPNWVRVFELPESFETPAVQVHDFDSPSAGAVWQPNAGSTFDVVRAGSTGVYRQASTVGNPSSWLPNSTARNQAIQAEVTIRSVAGENAWAGLMTRRTDDSNYYYVTARPSGTLELKRMVAGTFTTLGTSRFPVTVGRKYRLRLESIGTWHRFYINDWPALSARDASLAEGTVGIMTNRASADYDNVIVTPRSSTFIYVHDFYWLGDPGNWLRPSSNWQAVGEVFRQTYDGGYAINYLGGLTADQIVQVRVRPLSFVGPDNWVGVVARYQDERNHLYVSLRSRGVVSLWRRTQGVIQQLATARLTVTTGEWYTVRVEIVNGLTRVFVNDELKLSTNADPGPTNSSVLEARGYVGLITYKATAEYDDFLAYQP